jgi:hypothetical protein
MRNTFNISQLRQQILNALPGTLTPVGEQALEAFLALEGISTWRPDRMGVLQLSFVFDIGLPFALIGDNPSAKPLIVRAGDAARDGRYPNDDAWRVVHAGALLSHWGATVNFVTDPVTPAVHLEMGLGANDPLNVVVVPAARAAECAMGLEAQRPMLTAIDARGSHGAHQQIAQACAATFAHATHVAGVLVFEPRFWVGIAQKEWIHLAQLNPAAAVAVPAAMLGRADSGRQALRLALLAD